MPQTLEPLLLLLPGQANSIAAVQSIGSQSSHSPRTELQPARSNNPEQIALKSNRTSLSTDETRGGEDATADTHHAAGRASMKNLPSRYFILDEALQKESKWDGKPIEALALSGGGIKGIAFGGAVQKLDEAGMYGEIKNFAGTSAGSGFASLLAVGYSGKEVSHILSSTPIGKIMMAGRWNCLWRLYRRSGLYTLGPFVKFMDELFQQRLSGVKMCTFEQLYRQRGVNLVIPAINLDEQALVYLSHETNPRMPIAIACAASSAAPVMFEPVLWKGDRFVDGSLLDVLPADVFDGKKTLAFSFVGMEDAMRAKRDLWDDVDNAGMVSKRQSTMSQAAAAGSNNKGRRSKLFTANKSVDFRRLASTYTQSMMVPPSGKLAELVGSVVGILIAGANAHIDATLLKRLRSSCVDNVNIYTSDVDYSNFNVSAETAAYLRDEGNDAVRRYLDVQPARPPSSPSQPPTPDHESDASPLTGEQSNASASGHNNGETELLYVMRNTST